jgi:DHA2 family multidrug resistance protein
MFCLLPPTRLALGRLAADRVPDASGVFNLMRNLGGAIGLATIDTVIYTRSPVNGAAIAEKLRAGDLAVARFAEIPSDLLAAGAAAPSDASAQAMLQPFVEKAALVQSINEAWLLVAVLTLAALLCVPFAKRAPQTSSLAQKAA